MRPQIAMPRFSIITPTLLRESLRQTCRSIDDQPFKDYEHIVCYDGDLNALDERKTKLVLDISGINRVITSTGKRIRDFGNTPRHVGGEHATGDYLAYLDDDDYYLENALGKLDKALRACGNPDFGVFSCHRHGLEFFHFPPGCCMTTSCQWTHKRTIKGERILWPVEFNDYLSDGMFLEKLKKVVAPVKLDTGGPIVRVDHPSVGQE